ncbi:MAG: MerR family DNA-binding transcriptional regulator [Gordonia sp. (in: high G+C Gram-positive bacteria)]
MADIPELLSIGSFSSLTRISVRMLRHYHANGILRPVEVDENSGYRWYSPDQGIAASGADGCIEHDADFRESEVDESVFVEVPAGTQATDPLTTLALTEIEVCMPVLAG